MVLEKYETEKLINETPLYANLPSLQNMAALNVVAALRRHEYSQILPDYYVDYSSSPTAVPVESCFAPAFDSLVVPESENKITVRVNQLDLPQPLKIRIFTLIQKTFGEMRSWLVDMNKVVGIEDVTWPPRNYKSYAFLKHIAWTNVGEINHVETVKSIVASAFLADSENYLLACYYCVVELIRVLAPRVVHSRYVDRINTRYQFLVYYWTCCVTGDFRRLNSLPEKVAAESAIDEESVVISDYEMMNLIAKPSSTPFALRRVDLDSVNRGYLEGYSRVLEYMITFHVIGSNKTAFAYFWRQVPRSYRFHILMKNLQNAIVEYHHPLILGLTKSQQEEIYKEYGTFVLRTCLENPLEVDYSLEVAFRMRNILTVGQFSNALLNLTMRSQQYPLSIARDNYLYILKQLWLHVPNMLRLTTLESQNASIRYCVKNLDLQTLTYMIRVIPSYLTMCVLHSNCGRYICMKLIRNNELRLLKALLPDGVEWYDINFALIEKVDLAFRLKEKGDYKEFDDFLRRSFGTEEGRKGFIFEFPLVASSLLNWEADMLNGVIDVKNCLPVLDIIIKRYINKRGEEGKAFRKSPFFKKDWPHVRKELRQKCSRL